MPVYNGQFRIVQQDVVLADIAAQVAAGAEHITFGDPDFFNGPTHAVRIVEAIHQRIRLSPTTSRSRSNICCSMAICCRDCATPVVCL